MGAIRTDPGAINPSSKSANFRKVVWHWLIVRNHLVRPNHLRCHAMRSLLIATALIELGAGLALLCLPLSSVQMLTNQPLEGPAAITITRVAGAALIALAVACWTTRDDVPTRAKGLVTAMLIYNMAVAAILAYSGTASGLNGPLLWPGVTLHTMLTFWCITCLTRS